MPRPARLRDKQAPNEPARGIPRGVIDAAFAAAIIVATIIAYRPAMSGGFIWDDYTYIINSELNQDPHGLPRLWFSTDAVDYFPAAYSLQWLEYRAWAGDSRPYHAVNLALHCIVVVLLGLVLRRLAIPGAWIAAGLFALHPVNVESVAWIYQQRTTLPLMFALLSTLAFLRFDRTGRAGWQVVSVVAFVLALLSKTSVVMFPFVLLGVCWWERRTIRRTDVLRVLPHFAAALALGLVTTWFQYSRAIGVTIVRDDNLITRLALLRFDRTGRAGWQVASVVAFVLALLSKTSVVMFPFVLLGVCWWERRTIRRTDVLRVLPHFAAALVLGLVTTWFQYSRAIGVTIVRDDSLITRLATAAWATWFYAYKALVPLNLSFVYPRWVVNAASPLTWLPLAGLIGLFAVLWRFRASWGRGPLAAIGYYVLTLLPMLGFLNIFFMKYSLVADHWQYVGLAGLLALPGAGLAMLIARQRAAGVACVTIVFVALAYLTHEQSKIYASETSVWTDTVGKNPTAWIAWNNMGADLLRDGDFEKARPYFEKTLELNPRFSKAINNLAVIEAQRGNLPRAMELCQQAIALHDEGEADARLNVGRILYLQGRPQEAIESYRAALKLDNKFSLAYLNLAEALIQIGDKAGAAEALRTLLQFDRYNAEAAELLQKLGGP